MERTRILLADMPRMLFDIVAEVLHGQPDMEVVEAEPGSVLELAGRARADVVIMGADDPTIASELLAAHPRVKLLAVTGADGECWLYELRPQRISLGEVSPTSLVDEIRRRAPMAAWWSD